MYAFYKLRILSYLSLLFYAQLESAEQLCVFSSRLCPDFREKYGIKSSLRHLSIYFFLNCENYEQMIAVLVGLAALLVVVTYRVWLRVSL